MKNLKTLEEFKTKHYGEPGTTKRDKLEKGYENFKSNKKILIILDDSVDKFSGKMELMKSAKNDPLFHSDIDDILDDFKANDVDNIYK